MPAEGSGRSGREGLALLRTAISREWLVLIALISRAEAKPAVHRPRLAPRPWRKRNKGSRCKTPEASSHSGGAGCLGREPGSPETGRGWGGGHAARLADSPVPRARCLPSVEPERF